MSDQPTVLRITGPNVPQGVIERLDQAQWRGGWTLMYRPRAPGTRVFSPAHRRITVPFDVGVWQVPGKDELEVGAVTIQGQPEPRECVYQRDAVLAFKADVIDPIARDVGATVSSLSAAKGSVDALPERLLETLRAFADDVERLGLAEPERSELFPRLVALVHYLDAHLDGATLRQWFLDRGWKQALAASAGASFDRGRALLRERNA